MTCAYKIIENYFLFRKIRSCKAIGHKIRMYDVIKSSVMSGYNLFTPFLFIQYYFEDNNVILNDGRKIIDLRLHYTNHLFPSISQNMESQTFGKIREKCEPFDKSSSTIRRGENIDTS